MAAVSSVLVGCGMTSEEKMKQAETMLEDKYGEEFVVSEYRGQQVGTKYYTVAAYAKEFPDLSFEAYVSENGIEDKYVLRRFCSKLSDQILENMGLSDGAYIYTDSLLGSSQSKDPAVTIEKYPQENPYDQYTVYFYIDKNSYNLDQIYEACANGVSNLNAYSGNYVVQMTDHKTIDMVQDYFTRSDGKYADLDDIVYVPNLFLYFENGKLTTEKSAFTKEAGENR